MKKVAVTGAGGFIGSALCTQLLDKDYQVYGLDISNGLLDKFKKYSNFIPVINNFVGAVLGMLIYMMLNNIIQKRKGNHYE